MKPAARLILLLAANAALFWALVANRSGQGLPLLPNLTALLALLVVAYVYLKRR
ncbi:hypothetical protein [Oceanithermus sp.]